MAIAFADAASVMGWFLQQGSLPPAEAGALLKWIHRKQGRNHRKSGRHKALLPVIRAELVGQSPETLRAMVAALTAAMPASGLGTPDFAAVLDLSDLGGIEDEVDADTVVTAYARSIATGDYSLSAHRIGAAGAASLARMAGRTQALRTQFLYPLDVRARLAAATSQENEFTTADSIGRSLRTHIRILCRAIIGGLADAPADIFDALVAAVRTGALKHDEKGASPHSPRNSRNTSGRSFPTGLWPLTWRPP